MDAAHRVLIANIRQRMKERGLSINKLADFAGLGRGSLSDILAGNMSPTLRSICKIAEALEVSTDELLRRPDQA